MSDNNTERGQLSASNATAARHSSLVASVALLLLSICASFVLAECLSACSAGCDACETQQTLMANGTTGNAQNCIRVGGTCTNDVSHKKRLHGRGTEAVVLLSASSGKSLRCFATGLTRMDMRKACRSTASIMTDTTNQSIVSGCRQARTATSVAPVISLPRGVKQRRWHNGHVTPGAGRKVRRFDTDCETVFRQKLRFQPYLLLRSNLYL